MVVPHARLRCATNTIPPVRPRLTVIGPKNQGGLNNMDWSGHVQAILSEWILRWIMPPDRDVCAWKHVLHHMILVDKRGYDKFPEGREIFFCKMTKADKLRLMRGVPKRATYIRSCIRVLVPQLKARSGRHDAPTGGKLLAQPALHLGRGVCLP